MALASVSLTRAWAMRSRAAAEAMSLSAVSTSPVAVVDVMGTLVRAPWAPAVAPASSASARASATL